MEEIIYGLLTLAISGLGYLAYKHPKEARKLLTPILYILFGVFCFYQFYYYGKSMAYDETKIATSIEFNITSIDSNFDLFYHDQGLRRSIKDEIEKLKKDSDSNRKRNFKYGMLSLGIVTVLILLSFFFEYYLFVKK